MIALKIGVELEDDPGNIDALNTLGIDEPYKID